MIRSPHLHIPFPVFLIVAVAAALLVGPAGAETASPAEIEALAKSLQVLRTDSTDRAALVEWIKREEASALKSLDSLGSDLDSLRESLRALEVDRERMQSRLTRLDPAASASSGVGEALFQERILPLFEQHCLDCHGGTKIRGGFDLSTRSAFLSGGDSGAAVVAGDSAASLLFRMVSHQSDPYMPYKKDRLSDEEIGALREWIDLGAPWPESPRDAAPETAAAPDPKELQVTDADRDFWSFRPLSNPSPPPVANPGWLRNPIDSFILAGLEKEGLSPNAEAPKRKLIRRAYFDLIGLPPTPDEVEAFLADDSPEAYERLLDRLLDSPHFGERWGRHWLDLARYADSGGYEFDVERPTAYHYRDAVIEAFNRDLPYDVFLKHQLAGDEYEPGNPLALALTGFCTSGPTISNQETEKNRYDELDDILGTASSAMLGLTLACARCHDHKYDPIPTRDYYSLLSVFTTSQRKDVFLTDLADSIRSTSLENEWRPKLDSARNNRDALLKPHRDQIREEKIAALPISATEQELLRIPENNENAEQRRLIALFKDAIRPKESEIDERLTEAERKESDALAEEIRMWEGRLAELPPKGLTLTDKQGEPVESYLLHRGEPKEKRGTIEPGFLTVLEDGQSSWERYARPMEKTTGRRTALAEWIVDVEHGAGRLAARVIVNRLWQRCFGEGIVRTPSDFGIQGDPPTHPELLDWLAGRLVEEGWSLKATLKIILTSAAYRQDSHYDPSKAKIDPENRLVWRRRPLRLESEIIRDSMLTVAGNLNRTMRGPGVHPRLHPDLIATGSTPKWPMVEEDGPDTWRRSVYIFIRRSVLMPMLMVFDGVDAAQSCARRPTTVIPLQALELLNDRFSRQQAEALADRIALEAGGDPSSKIEAAFSLTLSRPPGAAEIETARSFIERQREAYESVQGSSPDSAAWIDFCQALLNLNEFIYVD